MIEVKSILKHNSVFKEKTKTLPPISICHRSAYIIFEHPIKRSMPTEIPEDDLLSLSSQFDCP